MTRKRWGIWLVLVVPSVLLGSLLQTSCKSAGPTLELSKWIVVPGATYVEESECTTCHDAEATALGASRHGKTNDPRTPAAGHGCQSCHGPGSVHSKNKQEGTEPTGPDIIVFKEGSPFPAAQQSGACLACHEKVNKQNWHATSHASQGVACTQCHSMHAAKGEPQLKAASEVETCTMCHKDVKAALQRTSHHPIREGKVTCSNCHDPHGTGNDKNLKKSNANDTCFQCHQEKRGPYLWQHVPVFENCLNCHNPHGTNYRNMLVMDTPRLCEQCHAASRHPDTLYDKTATIEGAAGLPGLAQNPNARMYYKGCNNCHSHIHGSNHPSGQFFQR